MAIRNTRTIGQKCCLSPSLLFIALMGRVLPIAHIVKFFHRNFQIKKLVTILFAYLEFIPVYFETLYLYGFWDFCFTKLVSKRALTKSNTLKSVAHCLHCCPLPVLPIANTYTVLQLMPLIFEFASAFLLWNNGLPD